MAIPLCQPLRDTRAVSTGGLGCSMAAMGGSAGVAGWAVGQHHSPLPLDTAERARASAWAHESSFLLGDIHTNVPKAAAQLGSWMLNLCLHPVPSPAAC